MPGPRLGGELTGVLRARHHECRHGEAEAGLRALPVRSPRGQQAAQELAGHRHRFPVRGSAGEGDPIRLPQVRGARRGDDRERDHLPAEVGVPRDVEGARLTSFAGGPLFDAGRHGGKPLGRRGPAEAARGEGAGPPRGFREQRGEPAAAVAPAAAGFGKALPRGARDAAPSRPALGRDGDL